MYIVPYSHARSGGNFFKSFGKVFTFQVVGMGKEEKRKRKEKKRRKRDKKDKKEKKGIDGEKKR